MAKNTPTTKATHTIKKVATPQGYDFVMGTVNYIMMVIGLVVLLVGYILLSGGGSDDPNAFNPAMFDARRLYVAPIMIMIGFAIEIVAIMYRSKKHDDPAGE